MPLTSRCALWFHYLVPRVLLLRSFWCAPSPLTPNPPQTSIHFTILILLSLGASHFLWARIACLHNWLLFLDHKFSSTDCFADCLPDCLPSPHHEHLSVVIYTCSTLLTLSQLGSMKYARITMLIPIVTACAAPSGQICIYSLVTIVMFLKHSL